jgi:hypothetical protein
MQKLLKLLAFSAILSPLAVAETYSGTLLDASCYENKKVIETCPATSTTTSFSIVAAGKVYRLDTPGNKKAAAALSGRADRVVPDEPTTISKQVTATVEGTDDSGSITVESVEIQ